MTERTPEEQREYSREIGRKGGNNTRDRHGSAHFRRVGAQGGSATRDIYGREFFSKIGRKGGGRVAELIKRGREAENA